MPQDGPARARRVGRLGCWRVVVRRRAGRRAQRYREPAQRRARRGDHLRAARGAAVARRSRAGGALHGRQGRGGPHSPRAMARAVAEPGLLRPDAREPGSAGAERHHHEHGGRRARLAGQCGQGRGRARFRPGAGRLGRAGDGPGGDRRGRLPAAAGRQGRPGAGHGRGHGDLGVRGGARRHHGRRLHRSQLRATARPARAGLLAAQGGLTTRRARGRGRCRGSGRARPAWPCPRPAA